MGSQEDTMRFDDDQELLEMLDRQARREREEFVRVLEEIPPEMDALTWFERND
jgi:hypothetical protein